MDEFPLVRVYTGTALQAQDKQGLDGRGNCLLKVTWHLVGVRWHLFTLLFLHQSTVQESLHPGSHWTSPSYIQTCAWNSLCEWLRLTLWLSTDVSHFDRALKICSLIDRTWIWGAFSRQSMVGGCGVCVWMSSLYHANTTVGWIRHLRGVP